MKNNDLVPQGEDLHLKISLTLKIRTKGSQDESNIANIAGEAYAYKVNDFNTDRIFGNHND